MTQLARSGARVSFGPVALALACLAPTHTAFADDPEEVRPVLAIAAGLGVGTREFVLPRAEGTQDLATSAFVTADLDVLYSAWSGHRVALEVRTTYQTSVAWHIELRPLFALPQDIPARSQRGELSAAPIVHFANPTSALAVAFPVGLAFRSFWPQFHQFPVQNYLLGGPVVRAELRVPLGAHVKLRAAPELQWLIFTSASLRALELEATSGLALGVEVSLQASLTRALRAVLAFRYSRATVPSPNLPLEDTERYITARIAGEL